MTAWVPWRRSHTPATQERWRASSCPPLPSGPCPAAPGQEAPRPCIPAALPACPVSRHCLWGEIPLARPGPGRGTAQPPAAQRRPAGRQFVEGFGRACPPAWVGKGDRVGLWQQELSGDLAGFCSHTPLLSYTSFSPKSSQRESSKLWVLPPGAPACHPIAAPHASAALRGMAAAGCCVSLVLR